MAATPPTSPAFIAPAPLDMPELEVEAPVVVADSVGATVVVALLSVLTGATEVEDTGLLGGMLGVRKGWGWRWGLLTQRVRTAQQRTRRAWRG
jgi:hypothetical protein